MKELRVAVAAVCCISCATPQAQPDITDDALDEFVTQFFDTMVDRHLEAGYEDPAINPTDPLLAVRAIVCTASINERTAKDLVARLILLNARDSTAPIDLFLSTQGGWLDSAFTIIDTIHAIEAPVNVWGFGGVYSAGALILSAATGKRSLGSGAIVMVHANLDASDEASTKDSLNQARFEQLWRATAQLPEEWFPLTGGRTYYLSPEQALRYGVADAVVGDLIP